MSTIENRKNNYHIISNYIESLNDNDLTSLLNSETKLSKSSFGNTSVVKIHNTHVFVKKIPLTDIEMLPENYLSTRNIFELPMYYQYGVGSSGFGAFRELKAHLMTTNWVINDECYNFPIMYGSRIIHNNSCIFSMDNIEKDVKYWGKSGAIKNRLESIAKSKHSLVVFLEYIPERLDIWLKNMFNKGYKEFDSAVSLVLKSIKCIIPFMHSKSFIHFDAYFANILTDGKDIYLTDFGLALSSEYELSQEEKQFMQIHENYDRYSIIVNLLHSVITSIYEKERYPDILAEYAMKKPKTKHSDFVDELLLAYALIALTMHNFYSDLQAKSKLSPYPKELLDNLWQKLPESLRF